MWQQQCLEVYIMRAIPPVLCSPGHVSRLWVAVLLFLGHLMHSNTFSAASFQGTASGCVPASRPVQLVHAGVVCPNSTAVRQLLGAFPAGSSWAACTTICAASTSRARGPSMPGGLLWGRAAKAAQTTTMLARWQPACNVPSPSDYIALLHADTGFGCVNVPAMCRACLHWPCAALNFLVI